jgi:tetratricopeptide (TPR) repeat protein
MGCPATFLSKTVAFLCLASLCAVGQSEQSTQSGATPVERYAEAGQEALAAGRYAEAQRAYEKLRELEPGIAEIHANLGLIYFQERKFDQAVPALRQALKLKPTLAKTDSLLAMSLSELGHYSEAVPGLEKGFHRSTDPEMRRMCGLQLERTYTGLRRDNKAVEVAMELNRLYPNDPEILYQTGKIYGNFAFLTMQKLAQVAPSSAWRHLAAAEAYESQGNTNLAIPEYRQVLALDPQRPGVHYRLGRTLLARSFQITSPQDTADAVKEFEQELQLDPTNANAAYEMGEIRRKGGQFGEAKELFEQALKNYPDFEEAHLGLAAVFMSLQKPELALPQVLKAIELNSANEVSWYRLSLVHRAMGNVAEQQKALAEFQRLHQANPRTGGASVFSPSEVTKQELDSNATQ